MHWLERTKVGLQAGSLAGAGVALFYLAADVVQLTPLETVAGLAQAFLGVSIDTSAEGMAAAAFATTAASVGLYTLLHFAAFAALGLVATWLVPVASFWATLGRGAVFGGVACTLLFFASRAATGSPLAADSLALTTLILVNAAAGVLMAVVFAVHTAEETA